LRGVFGSLVLFAQTPKGIHFCSSTAQKEKFSRNPGIDDRDNSRTMEGGNDTYATSTFYVRSITFHPPFIVLYLQGQAGALLLYKYPRTPYPYYPFSRSIPDYEGMDACA
jgi:hypothetical protein